MILEICGAILPRQKREVLLESWAADLDYFSDQPRSRLRLATELLLASIRIRLASSGSLIYKILLAALALVPISYVYIWVYELRYVVVALLLSLAYANRNLLKPHVGQALFAASIHFYLLAAVMNSYRLVKLDLGTFTAFWHSFGLSAPWVAHAMGALSLATGLVAISLGIIAIFKEAKIALPAKLLFAGSMLAAYPGMVFDVLLSAMGVGGLPLPDQFIIQMSRITDTDKMVLPLALAGLIVMLLVNFSNARREARQLQAAKP